MSGVAWVTVAATDLDTYLTGIKVEALREVALADNQPDPFLATMPDVIARIRNKIASCRTNQLSATANSIPPELKTTACWLILEAMNARVGLSRSIQLTEDQKKMVEKFEKDLDKIATCDLVVSQPLDPEAAPIQAGAPVVIVRSSTRTATRGTMAGI